MLLALDMARLYCLSLPDIQHNLQQLGWVETAQVARRFPNIIELVSLKDVLLPCFKPQVVTA